MIAQESMELDYYLDDIESRISEDQEESLLAQWREFLWKGSSDSQGFFHTERVGQPSRIEWPRVTINSTLGDDEAAFHAMTMQQLSGVSGTLAGHWGAFPSVRSNYGTGIVPSMFGCQIFTMPESMETLPTAQALEGGEEVIRRLVASGVPDVYTGQGARVFEMTKRFASLLASRPKIAKYVYHYHPDFQGPFDVADLVWGSEIFSALYETPELVHEFLQLVTATYCRALDEWLQIAAGSPQPSDFSCHWNFLHRGKIIIRVDSGMNISQEFYRKFSMPYDALLLSRYGGCIHSCGKVDHVFPAMAEIEGLHGFHLTQPEYNDMEAVYKTTIDRGHRIFQMPAAAVQGMRDSHRPTHGLVMI